MAIAKMVDPPEGSEYGFPKEWNGEGNLLEWIVSNGYPQEKVDEYGNKFYVKTWSRVPTE